MRRTDCVSALVFLHFPVNINSSQQFMVSTLKTVSYTAYRDTILFYMVAGFKFGISWVYLSQFFQFIEELRWWAIEHYFSL
mgnify:CR=1 FL=1